MSPHTGSSRHQSHCDKSSKKRLLKKTQRPRDTLPNIVPNSCYTETTWPMRACARKPNTADREANCSIVEPDTQENQRLVVFNHYTWLHCYQLCLILIRRHPQWKAWIRNSWCWKQETKWIVQINKFKLIFSTFITTQEKTINSQHTVDVWRFS